MKIKYQECTLRAAQLKVVDKANEILVDYANQGFKLTVRQLYYQFVARGLTENTVQNYKRIGSIVNDGRLGGLIDWDLIEDRTRGIEKLSSWDSPGEIVSACAQQFRRDLWALQPYYVEVWVEKEALAGVVEKACKKYRVPYLSCRGYVSQSEMWRAAMRIKEAEYRQVPLIIHLGDHDPSGIDMSRDIQDRLALFLPDIDVNFERIALNMDQIEQYAPPPNPAKTTDARFASYRDKFGEESWELDALEPQVITELIHETIEKVFDQNIWDEAIERENADKIKLLNAAKKIK